MIRNLTVFSSGVAVILACLAVFTLCIAFTPKAASSMRAAEEHSLNVVVDPRIELLAVVQSLSDYGERFSNLLTQYDFAYKRHVIEHFSPHKEHPAVKLFSEMSHSGFAYDAPPEAMLYLSAPPDLSIQLPFIDYLKTRAGGEERLEQFVDALRDFARETEFMAFLEAHEETFQQIIADTLRKMEGIDCVGTLEDYYGMKQNSYNIVLVPLFGPYPYGPRVERADGTYDIYCICGSRGSANGLPTFGSAGSLRNSAWHEFSHSFVNPTTDRFSDEVAQYSSLFDPISYSMSRIGYGNWKTCVSEHIVRAITIGLVYREDGKEAGERALNYERSLGFYYVDALCERLEQYENQRDKYPTFVDFYPELIKAFDFLPFGPINAVIADRRSVILVVPTYEGDKAVQDEIHSYVKTRIRDRFFKDSPIITDEEALRQDLSANSIIVYGTITGNLWLAERFPELPVEIGPDRIVADKVYSGDHLRFITAWPNPQNPERGVVIYTAQQAEDIVDINKVMHGPTDYVVARGEEVLEAGNYRWQNGRWTLGKMETQVPGEPATVEPMGKQIVTWGRVKKGQLSQNECAKYEAEKRTSPENLD